MQPVALLLLLGLCFCTITNAQNYHAIEGSPYAGSAGVANNPASILTAPYSWDLTLFSVQAKYSTNAVKIYNLSLLSYPDSSKYKYTNGDFRRFGYFSTNVHLLNLRLALKRKQAIAFGANLKSYGVAKTSPVNYNDTLKNITGFFGINGNRDYSGNVTSSSWLELFATYSRTLVDNEYGRLNGGITLKVMRGISGAFAQLKGGTVTPDVSGGRMSYLVNGGSALYGYSAGYDQWHDNNSTTTNLDNLFKASRGGVGADLGVEYLVKTQAVTTWMDGDVYNEYEWKIGVSILDIGRNTFQLGKESRRAGSPKSGISSTELDRKFQHIRSFKDFNDSLSTIVSEFDSLAGRFNVWNPTRLVVNVDRPITDRFAVNANLSLNLTPPNGGKGFYTKEMTLLVLTPRWETKNLGAYLPIQVTNEGKFWIGGAFKAGPLLLGVHNWANIFTKNSMQNGGAYLALIIHPIPGFRQREAKQYTCPKN